METLEIKVDGVWMDGVYYDISNLNAMLDLMKICDHFIEKCDTGRARSVKTYAAMKAALAGIRRVTP